MIVCTRCGERNPPGQEFCASCGEYLEWDAAAQPAPGAGPPQPLGGNAPQPQGGYPPQPQGGYPPQPNQAPPGGGRASVPNQGRPGKSGRPDQPPPGPAGPPGYQQPGYQQPGYQQPGTAQPGYVQPGSVQPGLAQPGLAQPGYVQPGSNLMQPTDKRRRTYTPPVSETPPANPGDVFCRQCGTPNEPDRRFCKSCGTPLVAGPMPYGGMPGPPKVGWWRRHFGRTPTSNAVYQAGDRPTLRAGRRWPAWIATIAALAAIGGVGVVGTQRGWFSSLKNGITDKVGKPAPFVPDAMTASSQASGHGPALAIDGISNKFWAPSDDRTAGQWIQAHFPQPFRLLDIDVTGGIDTDQAKFLTQERPDAIVIIVTDSSGHQTTFARTLKDQAGAQQFPVTAGNVVSVRLTIQSVYGSAPHRLVGVAEVEFFGKS